MEHVPGEGRSLWECVTANGKPDTVKQRRNTDLLSREYQHPYTDIYTYQCGYGGMFKEAVFDADGSRGLQS